MFARISLAFASVSIAVPALAVEVTREIEVDAPAAEVWEAIGQFCSIGDWYPGIDSCTVETMDGITHRKLVASDGGRFLDRYVEVYSDLAYGYRIIESPLPVKDYEAVFKVRDLGKTSMVVWSGTFAADGVSDGEVADIVGGIYQAGLEAIQAQFAASH